MRTFQDEQGRTWELSVDTWTLARIKDLLNLDLLGADIDQTIVTLLSDTLALVNVIKICSRCPSNEDISDEDFMRAMRGDAIADATEAFVEEFAAFSPSQKRRRLLRTVFQKATEMDEKALDLAEAKIGSPEFQKAMDAHLKTFGESFTSSPESLEESIPGHTHTDN